eukprot:364965-Chlamydomonas_euryale.AAC.26
MAQVMTPWLTMASCCRSGSGRQSMATSSRSSSAASGRPAIGIGSGSRSMMACQVWHSGWAVLALGPENFCTPRLVTRASIHGAAMCEMHAAAVLEAFKRLHDDGLIYRGSYMVNWSPAMMTAVSDLEVEYTEEPGFLYYFK